MGNLLARFSGASPDAQDAGSTPLALLPAQPEADGESAVLKLIASYAYKQRKHVANRFAPGTFYDARKFFEAKGDVSRLAPL